ncbi:MAG: hypothetical protein FJ096_15625, partial [Deltaproteobacteria bacterium]|nr:hypothetical protein [Deltaproteobacteria bacterium]
MQLGPRYRLLERLGAGSTARVYRAQAADGPTCILKIGHGTANGPSLALEAFHAHLVDSPRSPVLLALGRVCVEPSEREAVRDDDGLPALAFADRPGEPMSSVPLDLGSLSRVMRDLAEALEHLHGVGLAHGDLKPANVLVGERGAGLLDLGSVRRLLDEDVAGATPRYLGLGDATLGDARHRDLLALGLLVAEGLSPEVRSAEHPLSVARRLATTTPLHRLVRALLVPEPTARPAASWVVRQLSQATKIDTHQDPTSGSRQLRASYLRLRLADLGSDAVAETVASWARPAQSIVLAAHALCQSLGMEPPGALPPRRDGVLLPLDGDARLRWLASLVGTSASTWQPVLAGYEEQTLERAFDVLAESRSPRTFTLPLVAAALRGERPTPNHALEAERVDVETTVRIAYQLGQSPPAAEVLEAIERHAATLPRSILLDAAEALRLRGETARALRLLENRADDSATIAELLRRSGELEASRRVAEHVLGLGSDEAQRAAAIVARLALDANDLERAGSLVADARTAPLLEVAALVAHRRGDASEAARLATEGRALAANDEQRARLAATLAYVMHPAEPSTTLALFAEAAEHALRAGAVLEEASYRTGEASSALDLGRFDDAERASGRAILLFEDVLGRPGLAARAWLARASMWSSIGATEEAVESIAEVLLRAGQDPRARRFALFARCDVLEPEAHEAARDARSLVPPSLLESAARGTSDLHTVPDDDLRALARLLRHVPELELALRDLDAIVATRPKVVRLEWLHARIEQLLRSPSRDTENARR